MHSYFYSDGHSMELVVQPDNLRLNIQSGQNLLDVLRENAVPISYSCMSGRCGTCRCKVTGGELSYSGPETGRPTAGQDSYVLACQSVLTQNCTIEIPDMDEVVVHPAKIIKGTITVIEELTHDIRRLRIKPAKPMAFSPGQYAMLQFTPDHSRPYSWAGLPDDEEMEFQIRQVPGGRVTDYVFSTLKVGDAVRISGPLGTAYLRQKHLGPILCVGGGTGIAPIVSIVRGAMAANMPNPVHVYFGVRSQEDSYDVERLRQIAQEHSNMQLHVVVATGPVREGLRSGLVTDAIQTDLPSLNNFVGYFCGAPVMVEALNRLAQSLGMPLEKIHADAFYPSGI
jgi:ferredoxin-NAD(P)+ reductase (naphthalene dioxygenase ferredoxin-specific)